MPRRPGRQLILSAVWALRPESTTLPLLVIIIAIIVAYQATWCTALPLPQGCFPSLEIRALLMLTAR